MIEAVAPRRIYLDTNIFIAAFESSDPTSEELRLLFQKLESKPHAAVTSELTLAELSVREGASRRFYLGLLLWRGFIELIPVSRDLLIETGAYRAGLHKAGRKMKLPDAIHRVTAIDAKCGLVFSADQRLTLPHAHQLVPPSEAGLAIVNEALDA